AARPAGAPLGARRRAPGRGRRPRQRRSRSANPRGTRAEHAFGGPADHALTGPRGPPQPRHATPPFALPTPCACVPMKLTPWPASRAAECQPSDNVLEGRRPSHLVHWSVLAARPASLIVWRLRGSAEFARATGRQPPA